MNMYTLVMMIIPISATIFALQSSKRLRKTQLLLLLKHSGSEHFSFMDFQTNTALMSVYFVLPTSGSVYLPTGRWNMKSKILLVFFTLAS
jgi:hypothetical protein